MLDDARYAIRGMARTPGFTATALLMIALGTGANAAMFSVIDAVLVRSPFPDPDRVAMVGVRTASGQLTFALSAAQYRSLAESSSVFDALAVMVSGQRPVLTGLGEPRRFNVECVTADMFRVLGTPPIAGRTLTRADDGPDAPAVVVLSYQFWKRDMAGDRDAVGRILTLNATPTTIVGIMPRSFGGPYSRNTNDGWMPGGPALAGVASPGCLGRGPVNPFARVKAGLGLESAARQANDAAGITRLEDWRGKTGGQLALVPMQEQTVGDVRTPLLALLGAVGLVLLIACANVVNLQMERAFGRRRETAVRIAIGATRRRIVGQALTEHVLLYAAGCAAGVLAAYWMLDAIVALLPASMPHVIDIRLDVRVLTATFALVCGTGLLVGIVPVLQMSRPRLADDLRAATGTTRRVGAWPRTVMVAGQIALSLVLLVGATLLIRTFLTLRPTHPGFTANDKVTAFVRLRGPQASTSGPFFDRVFDRLRSIPGVLGVTGSTYLPVSGNVGIATILGGDQPLEVFSGIVLPNYFAEMQIPLVQGRAFDERDRAGSQPVAIVNEAFVRRLGVERGGVGATLDVKGMYGTTGRRVVIGVVRDTRSSGADTRARPEWYEPMAQSPMPMVTMMNLIVRTASPADPRLRTAIAEAVAAIDPRQVADRITPLADMLDTRVATWRFGAWLLGVFAAIALVLAAIGLASSMAWRVAQRTREIGVRMALGAEASHVSRMVLREALAIAVVAVVAGLGGAAASTRVLQSWLYGVTPLDPATFAGSAVAILAIAALASYLPARRASRVDPLVTLRAD